VYGIDERQPLGDAHQPHAAGLNWRRPRISGMRVARSMVGAAMAQVERQRNSVRASGIAAELAARAGASVIIIACPLVR